MILNSNIMTLLKTTTISAKTQIDNSLPISISKTFFLGLLIHSERKYQVDDNHDGYNGLNSPKILSSIKPI
jgi:hypothetical protein